MSYKVKLEVFEGPLDLLLYLIKREEIDIYDIPIARITEQYLEYLKLMQWLDLQLAGEFLVMASTLMQIKSRMLLPEEEREEEQEEEDPRAELVRRLLEYKKFKEAATHLEQLEEKQARLFKRGVIFSPGEEEGERYFEASLFDLLAAFSKIVKTIPRKQFLEIVRDEFTVEKKVHDLLHLLVVKPVIYFSQLFARAKNKAEIVVTFLAILELMRLKEIVVRQERPFGEIQILRHPEHMRVKSA